jgi:hypothetical protein
MPQRRKAALIGSHRESGVGLLAHKAGYCVFENYLKLLAKALRVILAPK